MIDAAVREWRAPLQVPVGRGLTPVDEPGKPQVKAGERLRHLIFDPLLPHLSNVNMLTVALDDALHLVPLVALPDGDGVLGDRFAFGLRTTLRELRAAPMPLAAPPSLLALGGVGYDKAPKNPARRGFSPSAKLLRTAGGRDFAALPATSDEADLVAQTFAGSFAGKEAAPGVLLLKGEHASCSTLERYAPQARYIHLATHGYFLDESRPSLKEGHLIDAAVGITALRDMSQQVRGYLPMTLCGLALAGANAPAQENGTVPGILTAQELAGWNLDHCELAVLSACDTNVGVRRAGQGIASLQEALYSAGVRASITSLWKVPDRATQELFTEFYRGLWLRGESKAKALWNAQQKLRHQKGPDGSPTYLTRDWAAWVLVGRES
jgi:CHAT domain-containing protein